MTQANTHTIQTLQIQSKTELLADMRTFVSEAARDFGFAESDVGKIELAIDEACTNIIKHAYRYNPDGIIEVRLSTQRDDALIKFIVEIFDSGLSFDSSHYTAPDMTEYFRKLRHGGLGIVLMRKLMDEVAFGPAVGGRNTIRLVKYLPASSA
ncbi:MAG: ATP-binding protein [Bacteroidetes bacterium]|nr:ATP-binding protein [Bacteroidota bacterium]